MMSLRLDLTEAVATMGMECGRSKMCRTSGE
jgi:hypothetical protein